MDKFTNFFTDLAIFTNFYPLFPLNPKSVANFSLRLPATPFGGFSAVIFFFVLI